MAGKISYSKIIVVVFITVLIWVCADLAKTEEFTIPSAAINVAKSTNPNLWVSFDDESSVSVEKIVLKGSASRIDSLKRKLKEAGRLEFDFDAAQEKMDEPGSHTLDISSFLQKDEQIKQLGLTVTSAEPDKLSVNVVKLVKKALEVRCVGKDQGPVKVKTTEPPKVDMFVPEDWIGERLVAQVRLTSSEIEQARLSPIEKTPYIELSTGQIRLAPTTVKIATPPQQDPRSDYAITTPTLGFNLSANLQGRFKVEVTNLDTVISAISIRATPEAKQAYENMRYQVILEVYDSDKDEKSEEPLRRQLVYNFPADYLRRDEIQLKQQPVVARFRLLPLEAAQPQLPAP